MLKLQLTTVKWWPFQHRSTLHKSIHTLWIYDQNSKMTIWMKITIFTATVTLTKKWVLRATLTNFHLFMKEIVKCQAKKSQRLQEDSHRPSIILESLREQDISGSIWAAMSLEAKEKWQLKFKLLPNWQPDNFLKISRSLFYQRMTVKYLAKAWDQADQILAEILCKTLTKRLI
jgi:hypothetical protein